MSLDIVVNGRPWKVAVEPGGRPGCSTVVVKGRERLIDVSWIDADTLSLVDGSVSHEVRVHRRDDRRLQIEIDGRGFETVVAPPGQRMGLPRALPTAGAPQSGPYLVKTPMPGRVVRVLVAVGDRVEARQGVAVVEAMKMENELRAPMAGTVTEVRIPAGTAVDAGTVLVVIE